jgi:TonB-dependent SusC/RagA subfamily outer membrane receptor
LGQAQRLQRRDIFLEKAGQRALYDENMRLVQLDEVVVTAKKIEKKDEARLKYWANTSSDMTVYREDFERRHPMHVSDMFYGLAGVGVYTDSEGDKQISIRGGMGIPLLIIDGIPVDNTFKIDYLIVDEIESIDIIKDGKAAIFGMRGVGGVISITTRREIYDTPYTPNPNPHFQIYDPIGYQRPVEFYSPKYDTPETKNLGLPDFRTTIYWKPDVVVSDDGKVSFSFYTSDFPTTYSIVIEGITSDGKIVRQVETMEVK